MQITSYPSTLYVNIDKDIIYAPQYDTMKMIGLTSNLVTLL